MKRNLDALDALKGVSALAIAFYAWSGFTIWAGSPFVGQLALCVDFFFVFTGFLIAEVYRDTLVTRGDLGRFAILRLARLYPIHLFFILPLAGIEVMKLLYEVLGAPQAGPAAFSAANLSLDGLFANLTLTQAFGWVKTPGWNEPSWYVAAEFWISLVFAVLCLIGVMRSAIGRAVLILATLGALGWMLAVADATRLQDGGGLARGVYAFGIGVAAQSLLRVDGVDRIFTALRCRFAGLAEVMTLALLVVVINLSQMMASFAIPVAFAFVILVFVDGRGVVSGLLRTPPFRVIGKFSYSIYMSHFLFIMPMRGIVDAAGGESAALVASYFVGLYLGLTVVFGVITERLVEQPTRHAVRRWLDGRAWGQAPKRQRRTRTRPA